MRTKAVAPQAEGGCGNEALNAYPDIVTVGPEMDPRSESEPWSYAKFTVIPEPGTGLLLGLGFAGVAGRARREERKATA